MRGQVFRLRHRDGAPKTLTQPSRVAEMIGMVMGRDHAGDRAGVERRREVRIPQGTRRSVAITSVDLRPAFSIGQKPKIDMVEREGQRHAQPQDTRGNLLRCSSAGRRRKGKLESRGDRGVHCENIGLERGRARMPRFVRRSIVFQSPGHVKLGLLFIHHDYGMLVLHVRSFCTAAMPSASPSEQVTYSISELAKEFALTTRAIRFYEGEGLLSPQRAGQRRVYAERERVRIKLILRGKRLGLSLSDIRELLDLYQATRGERAQLVKFLQVLAERRAMLNQQKEDIAIVLAEIDALERQCRKRLRAGTNGNA